jgi:hypothetical protein
MRPFEGRLSKHNGVLIAQASGKEPRSLRRGNLNKLPEKQQVEELKTPGRTMCVRSSSVGFF